ncbi:hypothetical protein M426DRAFT_150041 [Hypoxylon sp. CI-4A]|nr:hypothetical protein M426DRAFT_150041 [Hypoxylon sp. CI-4A]
MALCRMRARVWSCFCVCDCDWAKNLALCSVGRAGGKRTAVVSGADSDATSCISGTKEVATPFGQASCRPRRAASLSRDGGETMFDKAWCNGNAGGNCEGRKKKSREEVRPDGLDGNEMLESWIRTGRQGLHRRWRGDGRLNLVDTLYPGSFEIGDTTGKRRSSTHIHTHTSKTYKDLLASSAQSGSFAGQDGTKLRYGGQLQ